MKPIVRAFPALILLLVLFPVSLYAISVFDVIRLTQEKYPDQEIIKVIRVTDSRFVLTADDTARLKKEGVTENVIREMLSRPAKEKSAASPSQSAQRPARTSAATKNIRQDVPAETRMQTRDAASILDEIVRMTKAGESNETVLAYAKAHRAELPADMPADRLAWLRESGVSQSVILYLAAIDVRASNDGTVESATYASDEGETVPVPAYSDPAPVYDSGYEDGGAYAAYPEPSYPVSDYASYYSDYPYYGGYYYPYYGGYYPYYPAWFFVDAGIFFGHDHHGHGHGHGHDGHGHGHDGSGGGHHGDGHGGSPGDHPRGNGGSLADGQAWRQRPTLASNSFSTSRQPRGAIAGRGDLGRTTMPTRGLDQVSRGYRTPGAVSRPGFSGGRGYSGSTVARAPISRPAGSSGGFSRPAFSGGGHMGGGSSSGRAPIARSGGGGSRGGGGGGGSRGGGGMSHGGGGGRGR